MFPLFKSAKRALSEPEQELKNHYRSHAHIARLFSKIFYGGSLTIHEPENTLPSNIKPGVYWIDVRGTAYKYKAGSRYNPREAAYIIKLLERLLPMANERGLAIGIATPYSKQRDVISAQVTKAFNADVLTNVRVLSVHQFQGSEVDILLFSPVLAKKGDGNTDYWYVKNEQILNVAISRAKQLLLIVGDLNFSLSSKSKLKEIAEYCDQAYQDKSDTISYRPMNIFEKELLVLLKKIVPSSCTIEAQYIIENRFILDFAIRSQHKKIAILLDNGKHEIVGGIPVFKDKQRNEYLRKNGWHSVRIAVHELIQRPEYISELIDQAIHSQ